MCFVKTSFVVSLIAIPADSRPDRGQPLGKLERSAYWVIETSVPNISSAVEITRELAW
jgi:hypothetical protein